jgi:beta-lactam-binding protein with PASTA domain
MSLRPNTFVVLLLLLGSVSSFAQELPIAAKAAPRQSSTSQLSTAQRSVAQRTFVQQYPVPDFRGRTLQQAKELAVVPGTSRPLFASIIPANSGTVVESQDIPARTMVVPGQSSLRLTFAPAAAPSQYTYVSQTLNPPKTVMVPSFLGQTLPMVMRTMEGLRLKPNISGDRAGTVLRQDPAPNTSVDEGSSVTMVFALSIKVPSLKGLTVGDARQILANASLQLGTVRPSSAVNDRVTDQAPEPGALVQSGSSVTLITVHDLSGLKVPSLVGDPQQVAADLLAKLQLTPNFAGDRTGTVFRQTPPPGTPTQVGATVTLYLHSLHVPNLVGLPLGQALRTLTAASLKPGQIRPSTDENDLVVAQGTPPGTDVAEGTPIGLTTRAAPPPRISVPNVIGDTLDIAQNTLQSLHLTSSYNGDGSATVMRQSPDAGTQVDPGTSVTLQMGVRNVSVPNVVNLPLSQAEALLRRAPLQLVSVGPSHDSNDRVLRQSLKAGTMVPQNASISIVTAIPPPPPPQQQRPPVAKNPPSPPSNNPPSPPPSVAPAVPPSNVVPPTPPSNVVPPTVPANPQTPLDNPALPTPDDVPPTLVQVPDLVTNKLSDAAAVSALASSHLVASFTGPPAGIAVWQNPPASLMVPPGTTIQVQLEVPQVVVPNLRQDDAPTALETLSASHLQGNIRPARWSFLGQQKVVNQEPMPGSMINEGGDVQMVMGSKPGPVVYVAAFCCLAGIIGAFAFRPGQRLPPTPLVCTLSPERVTPSLKVSSTGTGVRYVITLRSREVETHLSIKNPPSVTEVR